MFKTLSETFGVSGYEENVRKIIINELSESGLETKTDPIGNLYVQSKQLKDAPTVIVSSHMDEIGFIITDINDEGYLKFDTVGDTDTNALISQRVKIGDKTGIISLKAIHLTTKKEREKPLKTDDLFIDIGAKNKDEAINAITPGDYCCFDTRYQEISDFIKGKALSGRIGCAILIDLLKNSDKFNINITGIFTVQKEVSGRGAIVASQKITKAELMINLDGVEAEPCNDNPLKSNKGAVIGFSLYKRGKSDKISELICKTAEEDGILYQRTVYAGKSNADNFRSGHADIPVIFIGIPCRHKKTGVNLVHKNDIIDTKKLIDSILRRIENGNFK